MGGSLEALWGFAVTATIWIGWLLWQGIAWVGWLLWQGVLLATEHWWLTLLAAAAVVICGLIGWILKLYDDVRRAESQKDSNRRDLDDLELRHKKKKKELQNELQTLTDRLNQSPDDLRRENNFLRAKLDKAMVQNRNLDEEISRLYYQNDRLDNKEISSLHDQNDRLEKEINRLLDAIRRLDDDNDRLHDRNKRLESKLRQRPGR